MAEERGTPASPTELGLRFGLPIAGLGEMTGLGEAGAAEAGAAEAGAAEGGAAEAGAAEAGAAVPGAAVAGAWAAGAMTTGGVLPGDSLVEGPLEDGLQDVPGQSGAEGLAALPQAPKKDPWLGP